MCGTRPVLSATLERRPVGLVGRDDTAKISPADPVARMRKRLAEVKSIDCSLGPAETLVAEEDPSRALFVVDEGVLSGARTYPGAGSQILSFFYPGDMILPGTPEAPWAMSVAATSRARVALYPFVDVYRACRAQPEFACDLFDAACYELWRRWETLGRVRGLPVDGRFAAFLVDAGKRLGSRRGQGLCVPLPMSRVEIASYLGLRTETVSRAVTRWRKKGLIRLEDRRVIVVPNLAQIEALAGLGDDTAGA